MSEPEWVDAFEGSSIADIAWLNKQAEAEYAATTNGAQPEQQDPWTPIDLSLVPDEPPVQPTLGGLGIAYPGKRHVFSGPQESAKTLCAYVIGLEVLRADGGFCLIDFEMGRWDARNRLRELGATQDELARILYFEPEDKMSAEATARILNAKPALVCIDAAAGAYDLEELDDNKRQDAERFAGRFVQPFWRAGIATIVLDHVVKNAESRGKYAIGSERKVGGADVHLGFEVVTPIKRGSHGLYKIVTHKDRGGFLKRGKLAEFELSSDPETHRIEWAFKQPVETDEEHVFRPTHLMEKVSRYLERLVDPVTTNTIREADLGKDSYVRDALKLLITEGYVEVTDGPNRSRLHESLVAYREAQDDLLSSASPVGPEWVPESAQPGGSVGPPPLGGHTHTQVGPADVPGASQGSLDDDDGIPF